MAPRAQWALPVIGLGNRFGFDETATPKWLMVGYQASKTMLLEFGRGKSVKSINPRIADVSKDGPDEGNNSFFSIEGKNPGTTRIEVRNRQNGALEATLEVSVKWEQRIGLSFNFVEDYAGVKTSLQPGIANDLINELNNIYKMQTNIVFDLLRAAPLSLRVLSSSDIVREERDISDNSKTGFARLFDEREWNKIFAANAENGFNIYFVPVDKAAKDNDTLIFTKGANCVIEDGKQSTIYTLAHAIGRMLGCEPTFDPNKMNHLMFWNSRVGSNFFPRSDDFIPKKNVNVMNP